MLTKAFRNFRALPLAIVLMIAAALPVMAGPFEDAVGKFANDEFSDTEEAVGVLATGGNPLAYTIISALQDGRLMADPDTKKVYVTQLDGKMIDAATGAPVASIPDSASAVRLTQRLTKPGGESVRKDKIPCGVVIDSVDDEVDKPESRAPRDGRRVGRTERQNSEEWRARKFGRKCGGLPHVLIGRA